MGRDKSSKYKKTLHQVVYDKLAGMQAFGQSKAAAKADGTMDQKIFSTATYETYKKHIGYYLHWLKENHPEVTTFKASKRYINEWLQLRCDTIGKDGQPLSAWTIQTECAALHKLYGVRPDDPDRFVPPQRKREDIKRSRGAAERDKHFSAKSNEELINFCRGTGCRRNVLERLQPDDLWTRERMAEEINKLRSLNDLTGNQEKHLKLLEEALQLWPAETHFIHHRRDKNGRYRFAPVIGPNKQAIVDRFAHTLPGRRVWEYVSSNADIHSYRGDYATMMYKMHARDLKDIPYDRVNRGTGKRFQSDIYHCRVDERGKKLDKAAMLLASKALGHNRLNVVADNYLRNL